MLERRSFLKTLGAAGIAFAGLSVAPGLAGCGCRHDNPSPNPESKVLVLYFSGTGNTQTVAEHAAYLLNASLIPIQPAKAYEDWELIPNAGGRPDLEMEDLSTRTPLADGLPDTEGYDVILFGHPIWHHYAPRLMCTLLEGLDLSGKTCSTFCTSARIDITESDEELHTLAPAAQWIPGRRFAADADATRIGEWLADLGLLDS